ncbi:fungal specific transcription factor domain-containing protein [Colletotrichum graminicola]|uniref:Fungal specific transcription factor domain-containing protein n=1 Tax=Colletotrichum graminicola (strain M1.001 / M2 / FGSC 10212) TaxID=645133 RepID=E3Q2P4_COLGM|nr:fungal specific transcription factor domain-containing protein [Colletotrichum graminicola M1.001]EFQ24873.1 fungal specific transcription factor domain-containing protein [Colletotrichum graminicola M1.001]WDK15600.1 fungal specific transcription factor domain-containing protein [Colletotrichum graminicola]
MSSSSMQQLQSQQFRAASLEYSQQGLDSPGAHSHITTTSSASHQAFSSRTSNDGMPSNNVSQTLIGPSHFANGLSFPPHDLHDQNPIMFLGEPDHASDPFATSHPPSLSSIAARQNTITVMPGPFDRTMGRRRNSVITSEDGSQDSGHADHNPLEDAGADEFGLPTQTAGNGAEPAGKAKEDKTDQTPAWSELKTKAGKERKRLPLACIACRRKKIRCSGEKPACKHCLRSRIPCVYKVTTRKAAPRTDYMAMLDKRLKRMEERIIKIVPKNERDANAASLTRAVVKPAIPGTLPAAKAGSKKRAADEAFGQDLDHWAKAPVKNLLETPNKPTSLRAQEAEDNKLFLEGLDALPSKEIQEHLAEVFFENIYGQAYHLLHKPSYMRKLRAGTLPPVLILSVCAVAARFSSHPKLNSSSPNFLRGEEWASHARDICTRRYEWPNITILTCLLILGLHEFGTCHGGRSWALGGQAIRMAFALQLHKDLDHDPLNRNGSSQLSFIDREIRRRTMWACFLMDRFNSSGTERPTFVREETVDIPLPIKERYFQLDMPAPTETLKGKVPHPVSAEDGQMANAKENMGVAAHMIKTIAFWGRVINYINQGGKELDPHPIWSPESQYATLLEEADRLLDDLPEFLRYSPENLALHDTERMANQFLFLHIAIHQNILFLNRAAVVTPESAAAQGFPSDFVTKAGDKTFAAANRISELLKDAESHMVTAPFVGYCAFSSGTIHILGIFSGNPAVEAASKRNLATNVKFLSKMKRYWGMFHYMSENLRSQYRTYADAARRGSSSKDATTASPIFQYGDWFDRYPHGVSQSDFSDPATQKKKEKGDDAVLEQKPELHTVEEYFTKLSPPRSVEGSSLRPNPSKRKSFAGKKLCMGVRGGGAHSEPLSTENIAATAQEQLSARMQQQRAAQGSLGAQASGSANFNPLGVAHSQGPSYHALSPISPIAVGQFGQHHQGTSPFYPPDWLSMSLHQQSGILQPLDRQLVFGGYSMEQGNMGHFDGIDWDGMPSSAHSASGTHREGARPRPHRGGNPNGMGGPGHGHPDSVAGFGGQEASTAWFMPFNMEPPEIGQDMGMNLDGFGNVFGHSLHHGAR